MSILVCPVRVCETRHDLGGMEPTMQDVANCQKLNPDIFVIRCVTAIALLCGLGCSDPADPVEQIEQVVDAGREIIMDAITADFGYDLSVLDPVDRALPLLDQGPSDSAPMADSAPMPDAASMIMDQAVEPGCDPASPPVCEGWSLKTCRADGSAYELVSCDDGSVCFSGACVQVKPNVILMVDTSGSMNVLADTGTDPNECEGDECAPWSYPECDDAAAPQTRLGRAKMAIRNLVTSDAAVDFRLALQRFPQTEGLHPLPFLRVSCESGWYANHDGMTRHHDTHQLAPELFEQYRHEVFPVPFGPGGQTDTDGILQYINFTESVVEQGQACQIHRDCPDGFCYQQACYAHTDPELRGYGLTPIGQSLFYAGEYFRLSVVREGWPCQANMDCGSQDYQCVEGHCRDALYQCRRNIVVVLSDGAETEHDAPDDFFNPRIQAKRLHFGLGCADDGDCINGAVCMGERCRAPIVNLPVRVCLGTDRACEDDAECPAYRCGFGMPACPGMCAAAGYDFVDDEGENLLRTPDQTPISVEVHVIDASGNPEGNSLLAQIGGGTHSAVDFADPEALIQRLQTLVSAKGVQASCR